VPEEGESEVQVAVGEGTLHSVCIPLRFGVRLHTFRIDYEHEKTHALSRNPTPGAQRLLSSKRKCCGGERLGKSAGVKLT
jgi:hypothetical protein